MRVRLYMTVSYGNSKAARHYGGLYYKDIETGQAPGPGERIQLGPDDEFGVMVSVKERWWEHDGHVRCDLKGVVIDPNESEEVSIRGQVWHLYHWAWSTESDGTHDDRSFEDRLIDAGWQKWDTRHR